MRQRDSACLYLTSMSGTSKLHVRMGHMNLAMLKSMINKELFQGALKITLNIEVSEKYESLGEHADLDKGEEADANVKKGEEEHVSYCEFDPYEIFVAEQLDRIARKKHNEKGARMKRVHQQLGLAPPKMR